MEFEDEIVYAVPQKNILMPQTGVGEEFEKDILLSRNYGAYLFTQQMNNECLPYARHLSN